MSANLLDHFASLEDPRIERNKLHLLPDILFLVVSAVCSGAKGWESIEDFGHSKLDWLQRFVPLANGIPSHDCIEYVMTRLSPVRFRECFISWTQAVKQESEDVIAIDGKTARGSRDRVNGGKALHMVSAWACDNRLVLAQEATDEKSNEITAIPKLLKLLELKGCIVTLDAMGCQRDIAKQIHQQQGDYIMGLKGNQSTLQDAVADYFATAKTHQFRSVPHDYTEETDKDHGRLDSRRYWITEDLSTLPRPERWAGLRSIGMVERECTQGDKVTVEQRLFISSIPADAKRFAKAVRGHWGIENVLHWRLDVTLSEDASRIRKGNGPAMMTCIRHLCVNLFEREGSKLSLPKKQNKAAWEDDFRTKVLFP